jgi:uracil-DNA glycosylase
MSVEKTDLEHVRRTLYERLKPSGWADKLKGFLLSDDFMSILKELLRQSDEGDRFTPKIKEIFRAFEECPYNDLKVIFIGQDPYPNLNTADGISFSCSKGELKASLKYIFREVEYTVYPEGGYDWNQDLARWSNQGVLMLNTALTTIINKVGVHFDLWRPFIAYLLDILVFQNPGLVYVFLGAKAKEWATSIPENNYKLFAVHPAAASYAGDERWDSKDVFNEINKLLIKQYNSKIIW